MGTTQKMAKFITDAKFEDIPVPAVNLAKLCILDAVGCALYGSTRPLGKKITAFVEDQGGKPVARVLGSGLATNAVNAAMANATMTHSDDFDDWSAGHQAVLLMPVVFALGEELHLSGKQALLSYVVGFDISVNVQGCDMLLAAAARVLPSLREWTLSETWAGLRPRTADHAPVLGPTMLPGLHVAGGQFRNGILFAPLIARAVADLLLRQKTDIDISAFDPKRFAR